MSDSLTNSSHFDSDASRSFAVFYRKEGSSGRGYFLFPNHGLAIECSQVPLVIGWDGRKMKHCSTCIEPGILSFFGSSKERVNDHCKALNFLHKRRSTKRKKFKDTIKVGATVYVRKKLNEMKDSATTKHIPMLKKPMIRRAVVKSVNKDEATITYIGNLSGITEIIDIKHLALYST